MWLVQLLRDLAWTFHVLGETPKYQYQSKSTGFSQNLKISDFFCGFDPLELWVPRGYIILLVFVGYYPISISMNCIPLHPIVSLISTYRAWQGLAPAMLDSDTLFRTHIPFVASSNYIYIYISQNDIPLVSMNNYILIIYPHLYPHYITIFPNSSWFNSQILSGYISSF